MNSYKLTVAGINPNDGITRFGGDADKFEGHLKKYVNDVNYANLCAAIEKNDVAAAFAAAHALKGVAGNLSLAKLYTAVCPLVEELRAGSLANAAELLKPVANAHQAVIAALSQI